MCLFTVIKLIIDSDSVIYIVLLMKIEERNELKNFSHPSILSKIIYIYIYIHCIVMNDKNDHSGNGDTCLRVKVDSNTPKTYVG